MIDEGGRPFRWANWALIAAVVVAVAPVIAFDHVITEDGASHSALATVMASLASSSNEAIASFYTLNVLPMPNVLATAVLAILQSFLNPLMAEKVWFAGSVILVAVSIRYAVRAVRPGNAYLALLAVPLGIGLVAHLGFYNYMAGFIMMSFTIGYAYRHVVRNDSTVGWGRVAILAGLFLLTYLGHILPFLVAAFVVGTVAITDALASARRDGDAAPFVQRAWHRLRWVAVALVPSTVLLIAYLATQPTTATGSVPRGLPGRVAWLGSLGELFVVFTNREVVASLLVAGALIVLVVLAIRSRWSGRAIRTEDGFLVAAAVFAIVYLVVPTRIGGGSAVPERLAMFAFVVAMLWLASSSYGRWVPVMVAGVAIAATIGFTGMRWSAYEGFDRDVAEYLTAADAVEAESTYIAYSLIEPDSGVADTATAYRIDPMAETSAYLVSIVGAIDLNHLHALYPYSPAYFGDGFDAEPLGQLAPFAEDRPSALSAPFADFEATSGVAIDHILLWGRQYASPEVLDDGLTAEMLDEIDARYELVHVSADRGLMEVYRRVVAP
jgi:hypothetical protein